MSERRTETTRLDRVACQRVRFAPAHARPHAGARALLRFLYQGVQRALRIIRARADDNGPGYIGAVAVHDGAKIEQQPFTSGHRPRARVRVGQRTPRPTRHDRGEWMGLAAVAPERTFQHSRDCELRLTGPHGGEGLAYRLRGELSRCANRCDLARILAHAQPLDELSRWLPTPRTRYRAGQPFRLFHGQRMCLESNEVASLRATTELFEEPIPNANAFDFDPCHGARLLARLLVVAEVGHQEQRPSCRHRHARRAAETGEIADIGSRCDEQCIEPFCLKERSQCRMAFGTPIVT